MFLNITPQLKKEGLAAFAACLLIFSNGTTIGWTSPALPSLQKDPQFKDIVTDDISSWIGALLCLGSLLGSFLSPFLLPIFGPKVTLLAFGLPTFTMSWVLILAAPLYPSIWWFYVSRFLMGTGVSFAVIAVPPYIIDIASPQHQGILGLLVNLIFASGILVVYITGTVCNWYYTSLICLCYLIPFAVIFPFMPDSPASLSSRGKHKQAQQALRWFNHPQSSSMSQEINQDTNLTSQKVAQQSFQPLQMLEAQNIRPFLVALSMQFALQLSGIAPLQFFSQTFFEDAKTSIDASLSSIIVAIIQIGTTLVVSFTVSNASRRKLMLVSQGGVSFCHLSMALYFLLTSYGFTEGFQWLPLVILVIYFIFFNIGVATFVWVVTAEVLPPSIRNVANGVAILIGGVLFFTTSFTFNKMFDSWGGSGLFLFYGCSSLVFFITSIFFLPETKEKTAEEINDFFVNYRFPWRM